MQSVRFALLCTACLSAAVVACVESTHYENNLVNLSLSITSTAAAPSGVVDPPFVSVIDSVHLVVTPAGGGVLTYGKHVSRSEKSIAFDVQLDRGTFRFLVSVLSKSGSVLFVGDTTVVIDSDQFSLNLLVTPRRPVMVISPDTTITAFDDGKSAIARATVHNRGLDSLSWRLSSSPAVITSCAQCDVVPDSGRVGAGGSQVLTFRVPSTFAPQVLCFTLGSAEGAAPVCWRKT
jgi:hypothetical protein